MFMGRGDPPTLLAGHLFRFYSLQRPTTQQPTPTPVDNWYKAGAATVMGGGWLADLATGIPVPGAPENPKLDWLAAQPLGNLSHST